MSRQFRAFRNPYASSQRSSPYLVVLQSDLLDETRGLLVAPLQLPAAIALPSRLHPRFVVEGRELILNVLEMAPMPRRDLGEPVAELDRYLVIQAYDALISGAWI